MRAKSSKKRLAVTKAARKPAPTPRGRKLAAPQRGLLARARAFLRDTVGHATTETVIMVPVLVAIWGGIYYTHGRYEAALDMANFTRSHLWIHAYSGCEQRAPGRTDISNFDSSSSGFITGAVSFILGSGILPGFNFDEVEATRDTRFERPAILGEGSVQMGYNVVTLCNEQTQGEAGLFSTAWRMFFGG